jgi:hypothetical protein
MSTSKFEELVKIVTKDYKETNEFLQRNIKFIEMLTQKFDKYLECGLDNLFFYTSERGGSKTNVQENFQNSIIVENNGFFEFQLLIQIKEDKNQFSNIYDCGANFIKNNLAPASQIVLLMSIKEEKENLFLVRAPSIVTGEEKILGDIFDVNPNIDNTWTALLDSCFEVIKKIVESGLEKRIRESKNKTDYTSQEEQAFRLP